MGTNRDRPSLPDGRRGRAGKSLRTRQDAGSKQDGGETLLAREPSSGPGASAASCVRSRWQLGPQGVSRTDRAWKDGPRLRAALRCLDFVLKQRAGSRCQSHGDCIQRSMCFRHIPSLRKLKAGTRLGQINIIPKRLFQKNVSKV